MDEMIECRQHVLEILLDKRHLKPIICELRVSLFVRAAQVHIKKPECLNPFPYWFYDPKKGTKRFHDVLKEIERLPKLIDITESSDLPEDTWKLLYWIFTNPLDIQPITHETDKTVVEDLRKSMNLDVPFPVKNRVILFKINTTRPKGAFIKGKEMHGTFFAYHGSGFENFHSIIHRGLVSALNKRSAYGFGTYLSNQVLVSKSYTSTGVGWKNCNLLKLLGSTNPRPAILRCVAIVEVVNDPSITKVATGGNYRGLPGSTNSIPSDQRYFVVNQDELMQLSHIIVYFERDLEPNH